MKYCVVIIEMMMDIVGMSMKFIFNRMHYSMTKLQHAIAQDGQTVNNQKRFSQRFHY